MKKLTFLTHYNCQINCDSSKLLIVADCMVNQEFVNVLCDKLNTNADLLYIDTYRKTPKNVVALPRHLHHFSAKSLESYLKKAGTVVERRMYPGTIFSMLGPTIKIMRGNKMTVFSIAIRVTAVIVGKIYNRLLGRYFGDVGITLLTRKV